MITGLKKLIEDTTKDWYTYGENKEENLRKKIFSYGMLFMIQWFC
jgi:hypothetical protein